VQDCADCPALVVLPAGRFMMGSPFDEPGHNEDESPLHPVAIAAFAIGRTHVTRAQFRSFVDATGYQVERDCVQQAGRVVPGQLPSVRGGASWDDPGFTQTDSDPVVCVSHADAEAYARWLSRASGHAYRLPSEAEWEYAARAGTTTSRWWGDSRQGACASANVLDQSYVESFADGTPPPQDMFQCRDGYAATAPAASFRPNPFGLYDMLGNARQWVADCYRRGYAGAPADGRAWVMDTCEFRINRGGAWSSPPLLVRSAQRHGDGPAYRSSLIGFRVARTIAE
jgi:formylglycine-generating enzyme required for sulfatase activity